MSHPPRSSPLRFFRASSTLPKNNLSLLGILEFAEGCPLGKSGLQWLKIHMANLYAGGVGKFSYEGRIAFTENHLDDIFDSADRPLERRC
ncbi:hypothetical protein CsSME_00044017 [Camellia sinensis var. sinensis]